MARRCLPKPAEESPDQLALDVADQHTGRQWKPRPEPRSFAVGAGWSCGGRGAAVVSVDAAVVGVDVCNETAAVGKRGLRGIRLVRRANLGETAFVARA